MITRKVFKNVASIAAVGAMAVMGMTASAPATAGALDASWMGQMRVTAPVARFVAKQARNLVANLGSMTVTATRLPMIAERVADLGSTTVTAKRVVEIADVGSLTVTAPRTVEIADVGRMIVTAPRIVEVADVGTMTVSAPRIVEVATASPSAGDSTSTRSRAPRAVLVQ